MVTHNKIIDYTYTILNLLSIDEKLPVTRLHLMQENVLFILDGDFSLQQHSLSLTECDENGAHQTRKHKLQALMYEIPLQAEDLAVFHQSDNFSDQFGLSAK